MPLFKIECESSAPERFSEDPRYIEADLIEQAVDIYRRWIKSDQGPYRGAGRYSDVRITNVQLIDDDPVLRES